MKVLIIRDKTLSFNGGIKRHCDDLYALMSACDVDVMPVEDLPATYVKWIRKYKYDTKALVRYIENSRCDVVHIHGFMSPGAVQAINAAYGLNKKIVYSPHFHPFRYLRHPMKGKLWFHLFLKPVLFKVDTIVTIGEFYQFNLSSCIRQQNSLTAQFVSFSFSNLANIFYTPPNFYNN